MSDQRILALFITGKTNLESNEVHQILKNLTKNYDMCVIYQYGAPSIYLNGIVMEWAFKNTFPMTFGCESDDENMTSLFALEKERAVVTFDNGCLSASEKRTAEKFTSIPGTQTRTIRR